MPFTLFNRLVNNRGGAPFFTLFLRNRLYLRSNEEARQSSAHSRAMEATGKRVRKETVAVYTVDSPTKKEFVIDEGKGTKLGDIPNGALPDVSRLFLDWRARSIRHFLKMRPARLAVPRPRLTHPSRAPQSSSLSPRSRAMTSS
jgi:hypothetical protein